MEVWVWSANGFGVVRRSGSGDVVLVTSFGDSPEMGDLER